MAEFVKGAWRIVPSRAVNNPSKAETRTQLAFAAFTKIPAVEPVDIPMLPDIPAYAIVYRIEDWRTAFYAALDDGREGVVKQASKRKIIPGRSGAFAKQVPDGHARRMGMADDAMRRVNERGK